MRAFLNKTSNLPSAFFCMNDIMAHGCMKALRDHHYRIPEDISIVGFDDLPPGNRTEPPLTTFRIAPCRMGERALEKLAEQIESKERCLPEKILISGELIIRNSVRKL
jgi:LacI family transcriptional regulator